MFLTVCMQLHRYKGILTNYVVAPLEDYTPRTWSSLVNLTNFTLWMGDGGIPPSDKVSSQYGVLFTPNTRFSKELFVKMRKTAEEWVGTSVFNCSYSLIK